MHIVLTNDQIKQKINVYNNKEVIIFKDDGEKTYWICSPDNIHYLISNLSKFCKIHDLNPDCMRKVANNACNSYKCWLCRKVNDKHEIIEFERKPLKQKIPSFSENQTFILLHHNGNNHVTSDLRSFCKNNDLDYFLMKKVAENRGTSYKGWKCKPTNLFKTKFIKQ